MFNSVNKELSTKYIVLWIIFFISNPLFYNTLTLFKGFGIV